MHIALSFIDLIKHVLVFQGGEVEKNQQGKKLYLRAFWSN